MARKKNPQTRRRGWQRRWRWLFGRGCLPVTIVLSAGFVFLLNLVTYWRAPYWVSNPVEYLLSGRLGMSVVTLFALQMLATWSMGLLGAGRAVRAAGGQGGQLRLRLRVIYRRLRSTAVSVLVLRVGVLIVLIAFAIFTYTSILGFRLDSDWLSDFRRAFRVQPFLVMIVSLLVLFQWLVGPFLRLRYSAVLGALASAWTRQTGGERLSLALSLRLGMGMLGALTVLWLPTIVYLVYATITDPYSSYSGVYTPSPAFKVEVMRVSLVLILALIAHLGGQIGLPELYLAIARARLKRRAAQPASSDRTTFLVSSAQAAD